MIKMVSITKNNNEKIKITIMIKKKKGGTKRIKQVNKMKKNTIKEK